MECSFTMETRENRIVVFTTTWCGDCRRAKRVFASLGVPYLEVDIEQTPWAAEAVVRLNSGMRSVPTVIFPDGSRLVEPSSAALEAQLKPYVTQHE